MTSQNMTTSHLSPRLSPGSPRVFQYKPSSPSTLIAAKQYRNRAKAAGSPVEIALESPRPTVTFNSHLRVVTGNNGVELMAMRCHTEDHFALSVDRELAAHFCPVFAFHSNEKYFPCSMEFLVAHSELMDGEMSIKQYPNIADLLNFQEEGLKGLHLKMIDDEKGGQGKEDMAQNIPVYAHVHRGLLGDDDGIDIRYSILFPYSGGQGHRHHHYDIQHVTVRLVRSHHDQQDNDCKEQADHGDWAIWAVYYSSQKHNQGIWCYPGETNEDEMIVFHNEEQTRPLIYVAKGSHTLYNRPKHTWWKHLGCMNDHTDGDGITWVPSIATIELVQPKENMPAWINFRGLMGTEQSLIARDYMTSESTVSQTCMSRFFCFHGW